MSSPVEKMYVRRFLAVSEQLAAVQSRLESLRLEESLLNGANLCEATKELSKLSSELNSALWNLSTWRDMQAKKAGLS